MPSAILYLGRHAMYHVLYFQATHNAGPYYCDSWTHLKDALYWAK